jgi:hypothetical protein
VKIELVRTQTPEDLGPAECAICGDGFEVGTVTARVSRVQTDDPRACPACVEALGAYRPDRFPVIEQLRALEGVWPTPEYGSGQEHDEALRAKIERWEREHSRA